MGREQELVDIIYSITMTIYNYAVLRRKTKKELMEWVSKQLEGCGFPEKGYLTPNEFKLRAAAYEIAWYIRRQKCLVKQPRDFVAEIARNYLRKLGFNTIAVGSSWGMLTK